VGVGVGVGGWGRGWLVVCVVCLWERVGCDKNLHILCNACIPLWVCINHAGCVILTAEPFLQVGETQK